MSERSPTVFVVDDDASFLASIERMLRASGYTAKGFASASDLLSQRPEGAKGCIVADLQMPGMDGMELQAALAESDNPMPIVFLSGQGDIPTSVQAMRKGAVDFLVKTAPKSDLLPAIERALARDERDRKERARDHQLRLLFGQLTARETEVLGHVLRGRLNKQIAADLGIDERSVKRHRSNFMFKLEVNSVAELAQLAASAGVSGELHIQGETEN